MAVSRSAVLTFFELSKSSVWMYARFCQIWFLCTSCVKKAVCTCEEDVRDRMRIFDLILQLLHYLRHRLGQIDAIDQVQPRILWQVCLLERERSIRQPSNLCERIGGRI